MFIPSYLAPHWTLLLLSLPFSLLLSSLSLSNRSKIKPYLPSFLLLFPLCLLQDLLFCTVEVRTSPQGQQWTMENFGCTLPAVFRRRRPAKKVALASAPAPAQAVLPPQPEAAAFEQVKSQPQPQSLETTSYKYLAPVDNSISDSEDEVSRNGLDDQPIKRQYKRQTLRQSSYFPQFVQYSPQPFTRYQYLPFQQYQPSYQPMSFRYQAYY